MSADKFIMSHVETVDDIKPLIKLNRDKLYEICDIILEMLKEPLTFEVLLQKLFYHYELKMSIRQHSLVGSTVRSYLSYLKNEGKVDVIIDDNLILWKTV